MKSIRYWKSIEQKVLLGLGASLFVGLASCLMAGNSTNGLDHSNENAIITNTNRALRHGPNSRNPFKGYSEKELWKRKPVIKPNLNGMPTEEEISLMQNWRIALEETASNPYKGRSAKELLKMKPAMHRVGAWPKDQEEHRIYQWWHAIRKADPDQEWKMPIEFYGVVLNQSNQPLSDAQVKVLWSAVDGTTPSMKEMTDSNGRFSVTNISGKGISVIVWKDGCRSYPSAHQGFEYFDIGNLHTPDPTNPVVFRLWEYSNPEPMYKSDLRPRRLSIDDNIVWVDVKGKVGDAGQVGFSVLRVSATNVAAGFTVSINAAEGAGVQLAAADDELMFLAPENGYQPKIQIEQPAGEECWAGTKTRFFLQTTDHRYAALVMEISQYNNGTAGINGLIYFNPSGSRNLQYREDLRIKEKN